MNISAVEGLKYYDEQCHWCGGYGYTVTGTVDSPEQIQCPHCDTAKAILSQIKEVQP